MFQGCFTALVTPFRDDSFDESAFQRLVDWQIADGVHGLVPCGTTGESPVLSQAEHERVVAACVETAAGRAPVMAGAGSNNTRHAVELAKSAKGLGADAVLVVTPYYNKPNADGLIAHFTAVADASDLPLFIYNIPGRAVIDMDVETMARLAEHPNIAGVKDATSDLARCSRQRLACGPEFIQLSGDDPTAVAFMAHGGTGTISVTSNVAPGPWAKAHAACLEGDIAAARAIQERLMPLHDALFASPSPGPAKYALSRLGMMTGEVRLPITPPDAAARARIDAAMEAADVRQGAPA